MAMNRLEELQFIADTLLIEKLAKLESAYITKNASVVDMLSGVLSSVAGSIANTVRSEIDTSSFSAFVSSLFKLLAPAMIFRVNRSLGVLYMIADLFGLDIGTILTSIKNAIFPKLTSGQKISPSDINQAGLAAIGGLSSAGSADMLSYLKNIDRKNKLISLASKSKISNAQFFSGPSGLRNPYNQGPLGMFPDKSLGFFGKLFAGMPEKRGRITLVGIIVWIVKTILASVGLLSIRNEVASFVGIDNKDTPQTSYQKPKAQFMSFISSSDTPDKLKPSGYGENTFDNTEKDKWFVFITGGSIKNMLLAWATAIYPELKGHEQEISNLPSFNRIKNILDSNLESSSVKYVRVPEQFKSRKQIVDVFAKEAEDKIDFTKESKQQA